MKVSKRIIAGCKANDRRSQEKLYRQFYPAFYALCRRFFSHEQDIITALNNGMLNIYKNIASFHPEEGDFYTWSRTVIRNAAINHFKTLKPFETVEFTDVIEYSLTENPFGKLLESQLLDLLNRLPLATRAVGTLYYSEGYAVKEIAEMLQIKEGTVKWHLSESRKKVLEMFHQKRGGLE